MNLEPGFIVVVAATLVFYLRLVILQREQAKRLKALATQKAKPESSKNKKPAAMVSPSRYSVVSPYRRDWVIAGIGIVVMVSGLLINRGVLFSTLQDYWWLPTAAGIVAFNWGFRLPEPP